MDYLKILENSFLKEKENDDQLDNRFEFLSVNVFNFTTYDSSMDILFGQKAVEVCNAISDRRTFDYIENKDNYQWYIIMCNMPFFKNKISWGTSIRGAFWDIWGDDKSIIYVDLYDDNEQITSISVDNKEWHEFITAICKFATK